MKEQIKKEKKEEKLSHPMVKKIIIKNYNML